MAVQSRKIFIDPSVLVAFIDRGDPNHVKASKSLEDLARVGYQLYTSSQNIVDAYAVLSREVGTSIALEFLFSILRSDMDVLFPQKSDFITAYRVMRANIERQITFREAINATLMQKRGVYQILTFTYWHNLLGTHVTNIALL